MTADKYTDGRDTATLRQAAATKTYTLTTTADLRDNQPADKTRTFSEYPDYPTIRTGNELFDALYALTLDDARLNAVSQIRDGNFDVTEEMNRPYFQTGEKWTYVWTRDIAYSVDLGLASLDPQRCMNSLLFKTTRYKPGIDGRYPRQIVQDTGSGGSYPVSTDRVVWAIGAWELLKYLDGPERDEFLEDCWQIMRDTIEHDRQVIYDPADGLYLGEQSFLDWREQSYPGWTSDNVLAIAESKALSTNVGHYIIIKTASRIADLKGLTDQSKQYARWAQNLKTAINKEFYIESAGMYSSTILDGVTKIRTNRFDALGESLAILSGVADQSRAEKIIANYPLSEFGPPVVWPQEQTVPIYHNHAYWPFVTSYWLRAAKQVQNAPAVNHAIKSLVRGTSLNLSNMENFDFVTGKPYAKVNNLSGPVINSRRQLWSVAGYMSMVQDVVFGLETSYDGIRFLPCITSAMHREYFNGSTVLTLRNFACRGKNIEVSIHLPADPFANAGIYNIHKLTLNDRSITDEFVPADTLDRSSHWQIWLSAPTDSDPGSINLLQDLGRRKIFGPKQPKWKSIGQGGITLQNGKLKLHFDPNGETNVRFNVYRNGEVFVSNLTQTTWIDPDSADWQEKKYVYAVESVYPDSGNHSHLTPSRFYTSADGVITMKAAQMQNTGGNLVNDHHFENWGKPEHTLTVPQFTIPATGTYMIRAEYSNGAGPINTGVTCSVKKLEIFKEGSSSPIASDYLVMPHTADWTRYLNSSSFKADLKQGTRYTVRISEDDLARNMSCFDHYEPYRSAGNGTEPYNYVNISNIQLIPLKGSSKNQLDSCNLLPFCYN
ncbi:hypothetical protein [Anaerohalosphaera lusitana]|nr:hypothetical protein [Anaerohalosphaera lusitana]